LKAFGLLESIPLSFLAQRDGKYLRYFFLKLDDRLGLLDPMSQSLVLTAEQFILLSQRIARLSFWSALNRGKGRKGARTTLPSPHDEMRRIESLSTKKSADLARLTTKISFFKDRELVGSTETPSDRV
jgi:hypothetical protein